jgi:hypothetical protein
MQRRVPAAPGLHVPSKPYPDEKMSNAARITLRELLEYAYLIPYCGSMNFPIREYFPVSVFKSWTR